MSEPEGRFRMKFIGKPDGRLMKNAPGNYKQGEISNQPYKMSKFPYWELVDPKPVFTAPDPSDVDNVFEEAVFVPDEAVVAVTPTPSEIIGDANVDPEAPASIKPYAHYSPATGKTSEYVAPVITTTESVDYEVTLSTSEPMEVVLDRDVLKKKLTDAGVEFNTRARTETLKQLVDELESEE